MLPSYRQQINQCGFHFFACLQGDSNRLGCLDPQTRTEKDRNYVLYFMQLMLSSSSCL